MENNLVALKCIKSDSRVFTEGKTYDVFYKNNDKYYIKSNNNVSWFNNELEALKNDGIYFEPSLKNSLQEAHDELELKNQRLKEYVYHWLKKYEREHEKRKQLQNDLDKLIKHIEYLENEGK